MIYVALVLTIHKTLSHKTLYLGKALLVKVSTAPLDAENLKKYLANLRNKTASGATTAKCLLELLH